jgi:hypothetical protein
MIKYLVIGGLAAYMYANRSTQSLNELLARMAVIDPSYDPVTPYSVVALVRHGGECFVFWLADSPNEVDAAMALPVAEINAVLVTYAPGTLPDMTPFPSCPSKAEAPAALYAWVSQRIAEEQALTQEAYVPPDPVFTASTSYPSSPTVPQFRIV